MQPPLIAGGRKEKLMKRPSIAFGALLGGLTSLPLIALLFLGEQFAGFPFVPFDLFDWLARVLPGNVITLGIDAIVRTVSALNLGPTSTAAKRIEQLLAIAMVVGGGVLLGAVIAWALRRRDGPGWRVGATGGLVVFLLVSVIEFVGIAGNPVLALLWLAFLIVGWGALLGNLLEAQAAPPVTDEARAARRAALMKIAGGSAAIAFGAWGLGRVLQAQQEATGAGQPLADLATATPEPTATTQPAPGAQSLGGAPTETSTPGTSPLPSSTPLPQPTATATMRDRVQPAPGTRLELTPNEDFYRIDINTRPVSIEEASWVLEVDGLFDNPRPLTLSDLTAYPAATQAITLSCISNPVAGDLIGTSNWTGVRLRDVLKDLGLRAEAQELYIEAADGFYESVAMEDLMDPRTLLVYGMNGETLPVEHGFPLRIYIPNRYGMKQPKWIKRIEAIDHQGPGYWVERGWSAEARVQIVSVIDTVAKDHVVDGKVPIGGIAWAGDRGIQKVEVQVDGGEWTEAVLRTPPLSSLTWVQWRYDWPLSTGRHRFRVRATDGTGALQIEEVSGVRPNGATGYHLVTVDI
jgi:DMSO/TMAO reductase YedYZ molybdopterin-dependent catalytic subunit